jgi:hypothetical protein
MTELAREADVDLETVKLYREESKAARDKVEGLLDKYRANTSTLLALATAALAFFGFADGPREATCYVIAVVAYIVAVGVAIWIYLPTPVLVNAASGTQEAIFSDPDHPFTPEEINYAYATAHQEAIAEGIATVTDRWGLANRFVGLIVAIAVLIVAASLSVTLGESAPPAPTHVIIEKGAQ